MEEGKHTSVALIEDSKNISDHLKVLIESVPGFKISAVCVDYNDAVEQLPRLRPHVVLTDINLPGRSGIDCVRTLKPLLPNTEFIMLTMYSNDELVFQALQVGASGYLLKRTPPDKIIDAIREVLRGGSPMSMEIARLVVKSFSQKQSQTIDPSATLTSREMEILGHLSKGMRYKDIADTLFISIETVRSHLRKIYEKLQVRSGTEAVLYYLKQINKP
ncbi:MAG: response regulator transcription factor [Ignavibacteriales bacterium]|nr:response regulator transcription factor [Ignavibacteriales bacterium]